VCIVLSMRVRFRCRNIGSGTAQNKSLFVFSPKSIYFRGRFNSVYTTESRQLFIRIVFNIKRPLFSEGAHVYVYHVTYYCFVPMTVSCCQVMIMNRTESINPHNLHHGILWKSLYSIRSTHKRSIA